MTAQTMPIADRSAFLRRALQADAAICLISGAVLSAGAGALAGPLGIPSALLLPLGLALLPWGSFIWYVASRPEISRRAVWAIIILNALYMIDSLVVLAAGWLPLTAAGWWFWLAQGLAGGAVAELQYLGLRRARG